jgi:hypothetical protein
MAASGSTPHDDEYYESEDEYEWYENEYVDDYDSDDYQVRDRNYVDHTDEPIESYFPDEDETELDAEAFASDLFYVQTRMTNVLRMEPQRTVQRPTPPPAAKTAKDSEDACFVCFTNVPDAMFPQCGHSGLCCVCADKIVKSTQKKCPLCRGAATSFAMKQEKSSNPWSSVEKESESDAWDA